MWEAPCVLARWTRRTRSCHTSFRVASVLKRYSLVLVVCRFSNCHSHLALFNIGPKPAVTLAALSPQCVTHCIGDGSSELATQRFSVPLTRPQGPIRLLV